MPELLGNPELVEVPLPHQSALLVTGYWNSYHSENRQEATSYLLGDITIFQL